MHGHASPGSLLLASVLLVGVSGCDEWWEEDPDDESGNRSVDVLNRTGLDITLYYRTLEFGFPIDFFDDEVRIILAGGSMEIDLWFDDLGRGELDVRLGNRIRTYDLSGYDRSVEVDPGDFQP